jgi:hypothetical protein
MTPIRGSFLAKSPAAWRISWFRACHCPGSVMIPTAPVRQQVRTEVFETGEA